MTACGSLPVLTVNNTVRTGSWNTYYPLFWIYVTSKSCAHVERIESILDSQLREFSSLGKDQKFYTMPEYPKAAWYELVVNACVDQSYSNRTRNIFVKMFPDRLEVISPGGFPPLVTPENIYDIHQPRNPYLMEALYYLDLVKCAHEGTRRIRDTMADMNLRLGGFISNWDCCGSDLEDLDTA